MQDKNKNLSQTNYKLNFLLKIYKIADSQEKSH